jgi:hypothetical protein
MPLIALPESLFGPNHLDKTRHYIVPPPVAMPTLEGVPKRVNHEMAMHTLSAYHHGLAVDEHHRTRKAFLGAQLLALPAPTP